MSWREVSREKTRDTTHVTWRCSWCGRLAVSGGHTPSACVCAKAGR